MKTALIGLALALLPGAAIAQEPPARGGGGGGAMMRADADNDGVVTRAEALAQAGQRFDRMDTNRDGKLTSDELERVGRALGRMRGGGDMPPPPAN